MSKQHVWVVVNIRVSGDLMELITEFMYKTFQRESKWRTKKIFMRNCQYQRILFLYWAIAFPQNCYFDMYIYTCIYIYIYIWKNILHEYIYIYIYIYTHIYTCFVHLTFSNPACKFTRLSSHTHMWYTCMHIHNRTIYIYIYLLHVET